MGRKSKGLPAINEALAVARQSLDQKIPSLRVFDELSLQIQQAINDETELQKGIRDQNSELQKQVAASQNQLRSLQAVELRQAESIKNLTDENENIKRANAAIQERLLAIERELSQKTDEVREVGIALNATKVELEHLRSIRPLEQESLRSALGEAIQRRLIVEAEKTSVEQINLGLRAKLEEVGSSSPTMKPNRMAFQQVVDSFRKIVSEVNFVSNDDPQGAPPLKVENVEIELRAGLDVSEGNLDVIPASGASLTSEGLSTVRFSIRRDSQIRVLEDET